MSHTMYSMHTKFSIKGNQLKLDLTDWTPRETLEERLEKTSSDTRCFAQGSSLICCPILESLIYRYHTWGRGAGPVLPWACLPGRRPGLLHRVLPRIWPYFEKRLIEKAGKNILRGPYKLCPVMRF